VGRGRGQVHCLVEVKRSWGRGLEEVVMTLSKGGALGGGRTGKSVGLVKALIFVLLRQ